MGSKYGAKNNVHAYVHGNYVAIRCYGAKEV